MDHQEHRRRLKRHRDQLPSRGATLIGPLFACLALAAGAISMTINISFGLQTSAIAAAVFGLSDCAKILLPMAAASLGGWNLRRRIAWCVAVVISVAAALSSLLEAEAQRLNVSQAATEAAGVARADRARARQDLSTISEAMSAASLQALADDAKAEAVREQTAGGCGERCRAQKLQRNDYLTRLGAAERRDALQTVLAKSGIAAEPAQKQALGAADTIAALTGADKARIAIIISLAISIAMLIILELLASLSGDAVMLLRRTAGTREEARKPPVKRAKLTAQRIAKPGKVVANRDYYLARLERDHRHLAARVHGGELSVYRASIEAGLRKAPARNWSRPEAYALMKGERSNRATPNGPGNERQVM